MDYLMYTAAIVAIVLILYGMLVSAEEKAEAIPHDEPVEPTPELDPEVYNMALARLLIDAELRGLELVQKRGDDEAGKGARV